MSPPILMDFFLLLAESMSFLESILNSINNTWASIRMLSVQDKINLAIPHRVIEKETLYRFTRLGCTAVLVEMSCAAASLPINKYKGFFTITNKAYSKKAKHLKCNKVNLRPLFGVYRFGMRLIKHNM